MKHKYIVWTDCRDFLIHISDIKDKYSSTIDSDPSHCHCHAFTNSYNTNFQQQRKLKASLNPLNLRIPAAMIKYPLNYLNSCADITSPLNRICNTSLLSGAFPQCLKYSIVNRYLKKVKNGHFQLQTNIHTELFLKSP
jgi:hypothetical protein